MVDEMLNELDRIKALYRAFGIRILEGQVSTNQPPLIMVQLLMTEEQCSEMIAILTEMLARRGQIDEAGNPIKDVDGG